MAIMIEPVFINYSDSKSEVDTGIKKLWETDPDLFGIRRSSRQKDVVDSKPPKLQPQVKRSSKPPKKVTPKKRKLSSDENDSSDEEVTRYANIFAAKYSTN